ncbi:short chain dehydrogenase [Gracilimonas sp. BCB1]|uniref:short chain dehydrogenase n=1 Tax=Gracilimonas sp. BCB1 TaxID=3152362 RepID=UPI0032D8B6B0
MKIVIVGATGTIGAKVTAELEKRHEIIKVGSSSGDIQMDMTSHESIEKMYKRAGKVDAVIVAAGSAAMKPFSELEEEDFYVGIKSKMMGQINVVLAGREYINDNGSFTLTTGILSEDPIKGSVALGMVNGAVNSFGLSAAAELKRGVRLNVVSPGLVEDSAAELGSYFPGHNPVAMDKVVNAYVKSVEGIRTGEIIKVY